MLTFLIGGARGKSSFAESLCSQEQRVTHLATARVQDKEMAERVRLHRQDRPAHWITIEEPLDVEVAVRQALENCDVVLLDCLTVWLSNLLYDHRRRPAPRSKRPRYHEPMRLPKLLQQGASSWSQTRSVLELFQPRRSPGYFEICSAA
jgi:adenosyl cobinamide kinase/adenosyl cobinamide phosphate guanylyltransferase